MLLCANLTDPAPFGAARGCGPVAGMSAGHGPPPIACDCGAAPGLSTGHEPLCVARSRGLAVTAAPGLSVGHMPLCATRGRGPTVTVGLRWTCGLDSFAGDQWQTACSWRRRSQ
jgi:hypothetical protein